MPIYRLDLQLLRIWEYQGPEWAIVAVLCLIALCFARLSRAFIVGMLVLLGSLIWLKPLIVLAHVLRWWIFGILSIRGAAFVLRQPSNPLGGRVPWPIVALGMMAVMSAAWAEHVTFAVLLSGTFACTLVLTFVVAWRLMDTEDFFPYLCKGALAISLLLQGSGVVMGGIALATGDSELVRLTGVDTRFMGMTMNANGNGVFAALFWPVVLAAPRVYLGRFAWLRGPALVVLLISIVFSGSRTAAGVTIMTTLLFTLYRYRVGAVLATSLAGVFLAAFLFATPLEELEGSVIDEVVVRSDSLGDFGGRLESWEMGWEVAMERPWFGHGWGAARTLGEQDTSMALEMGKVRYATNLHSAHLSLLVDVGWVGLGLFWLFAISVVRGGLSILSAPISPATTVSVLFFASTMGLLVDTFVHGGILSAGSPNALLFWFSAALVVKQSQVIGAADEPDGVARAEASTMPTPAVT